MMDFAELGLLLVGAALLFAGATLSSYGVGSVGALLGGSVGYMGGPTVGALVGFEGTAAVAVGILLGAVVGVVVTYVLLSAAVATVSFLVGIFVGLSVLAPVLVDGAWYLEWGAALGFGVLAAAFGFVMTRTATILITSFVGAALVSRSVTFADLEAAQAAVSIDPLLVDAGSPLFVALFVLGILSQVGLFKLGYVTRVVRVLPGASVLRDRGGRGEAGG